MFYLTEFSEVTKMKQYIEGQGEEMIRTVVFDIGKVLCAFDWESYIDHMLLNQEQKERLKKVTVRSELWNEHDRGLLTDEDIVNTMCEKEPSLSPYIREFMSQVTTMITEYEYSGELVRKIKEQGLQVLLLSNYSETTFLEGEKRFEFMKYIDGKVISYEYKVVKPERRIYEILLEKYQVIPEETVFLDDRKDNIEVASQMGMHGIVFENLEQVLRELKQLGVVSEEFMINTTVL